VETDGHLVDEISGGIVRSEAWQRFGLERVLEAIPDARQRALLPAMITPQSSMRRPSAQALRVVERRRPRPDAREKDSCGVGRFDFVLPAPR
jgi:hypothetical protein